MYPQGVRKSQSQQKGENVNSIDQRRQAIFARSSTKNLIESARALEALGQSKAPEQRMAAAWICDELERRAGRIRLEEEAEFERIFDQPDTSYLDALLAMRPQLLNL